MSFVYQKPKGKCSAIDLNVVCDEGVNKSCELYVLFLNYFFTYRKSIQIVWNREDESPQDYKS